MAKGQTQDQGSSGVGLGVVPGQGFGAARFMGNMPLLGTTASTPTFRAPEAATMQPGQPRGSIAQGVAERDAQIAKEKHDLEIQAYKDALARMMSPPYDWTGGGAGDGGGGGGAGGGDGGW